MKKRLLIISMSGGFGHIRAGEALLDYAKEHLPQLQAEHVDISDIDPALKKYSRFYDHLSKRLPSLWGFMYEYVPSSVWKSVVAAGGAMDAGVSEFVEQKNPDAVIFTNTIIMPLFNRWLKKKCPEVKVGVVVTDYHAHPYYRSGAADYYFVGHGRVAEDLAALGVPKDRIFVTGIPINPRFYAVASPEELKRAHGIAAGLPVVLFIASFRSTPWEVRRAIAQLLQQDPPLYVIAVTAGNQALYEALKAQLDGHARLLLKNWTNTMEEYLAMADAVVGKAGGLTVSECLALNKKMIIVNPIPGQEEHNARFVEGQGMGEWVASTAAVPGAAAVLARNALSGQLDLIPQENPCKKILQHFV